MLLGVSFSATFTNMLTEERLKEVSDLFHPILGICLLGAIVDLGAPLDYHLILDAGLFTFLYILSRACGKYFGARLGAKGIRIVGDQNLLWSPTTFLYHCNINCH